MYWYGYTAHINAAHVKTVQSLSVLTYTLQSCICTDTHPSYYNSVGISNYAKYTGTDTRSTSQKSTKRFGVSTFWSVHVLVCRHFSFSAMFWWRWWRCFGLSTFWSFDVSFYRRLGLWTFQFVSRHFALSSFWSFDVLLSALTKAFFCILHRYSDWLLNTCIWMQSLMPRTVKQIKCNMKYQVMDTYIKRNFW